MIASRADLVAMISALIPLDGSRSRSIRRFEALPQLIRHAWSEQLVGPGLPSPLDGANELFRISASACLPLRELEGPVLAHAFEICLRTIIVQRETLLIEAEEAAARRRLTHSEERLIETALDTSDSGRYMARLAHEKLTDGIQELRDHLDLGESNRVSAGRDRCEQELLELLADGVAKQLNVADELDGLTAERTRLLEEIEAKHSESLESNDALVSLREKARLFDVVEREILRHGEQDPASAAPGGLEATLARRQELKQEIVPLVSKANEALRSAEAHSKDLREQLRDVEHRAGEVARGRRRHLKERLEVATRLCDDQLRHRLEQRASGYDARLRALDRAMQERAELIAEHLAQQPGSTPTASGGSQPITVKEVHGLLRHVSRKAMRQASAMARAATAGESNAAMPRDKAIMSAVDTLAWLEHQGFTGAQDQPWPSPASPTPAPWPTPGGLTPGPWPSPAAGSGTWPVPPSASPQRSVAAAQATEADETIRQALNAERDARKRLERDISDLRSRVSTQQQIRLEPKVVVVTPGATAAVEDHTGKLVGAGTVAPRALLPAAAQPGGSGQALPVVRLPDQKQERDLCFFFVQKSPKLDGAERSRLRRLISSHRGRSEVIRRMIELGEPWPPSE